jgi:TetR/AcrR family fatty acid metabolism transcriptional regulator
MRSEIQTVDQPRRSFIEAARRAQIIECAIAAIAEMGFAQASLAQIAKRAGVSTGVISYYFAGKDDLIREVGAHVFATGEALIRPRVDGQETAAGALRDFIKASVAFIQSHPSYGRAILNITRAGRDDRDRPRLDPSILQPRLDGFKSILAWGQQTGEFRAFSVPVMAVTIIEALDAVPQQLVEEPGLDLDAYAAELVELFDRATRKS